MGIKNWSGSSWNDIVNVSVWDGTQWVGAQAVYVWNGTQWVQVWPTGIILILEPNYTAPARFDVTLTEETGYTPPEVK